MSEEDRDKGDGEDRMIRHSKREEGGGRKGTDFCVRERIGGNGLLCVYRSGNRGSEYWSVSNSSFQKCVLSEHVMLARFRNEVWRTLECT